MIEDMRIRGMGDKAQKSHIRSIKDFAKFLATVINQLPVMPADPNLIVFALGAGWTLNMSASPNVSAAYATGCFILFSFAFFWLSYVLA